MNKEEMMNKISEMENEIKNLKDEIIKDELNKQEEPKRRWKLKFEERYWFINNDSSIPYSYWDNCKTDNNRYKLGNCFKTEEEAKFAVEQLKVIAELKEYADDDKKWNCSNAHWCINYEADNGHIEVGCYHDTITISFNIYFSSPEQTQKAINAIGAERLKKYYFCVEG